MFPKMVVPSSHPCLYDFPLQTIHLPGYSHCRKLPYIYNYIIHYPSSIIPLPSSLLLRSQVPYWRLRAQPAWSTRWDSCLSGSPVALQDGSVLNNQLYLGLSSTSYWTHVWENNPYLYYLWGTLEMKRNWKFKSWVWAWTQRVRVIIAR